MTQLVKIIKDDDGVMINDSKWHLSDPVSLGAFGVVFCTGEVFGSGESNVEYDLKMVDRGGIECETCLERLRIYKSIKL